MSALRECPFCSARPHQHQEKVRRCQLHGEPIQDFTVKCPHGCAQQTRGSREAAIAAWNRRATPAEVEKLRAERDDWKRLCTVAEPEVATLRARVERLEGALEDLVGSVERLVPNRHHQPHSVFVARAALEDRT